MKKIFGNLYRDPEAGKFIYSMLIFGIAIGLFNGVFNNFLHDVLSIGRLERGFLELPREVPGLAMMLIIALLHRYSEIRLVSIAIIVSMAGLAGMAFLGSYRSSAVFFLIIWSTGEHMMMPIRHSVALHMAKQGKEGMAMGGVASARNTGQVAGFYLIPLIFLFFRKLNPEMVRSSFEPYRGVFILGLIILAAGLFVSLRMKKVDTHVQRQRLVFKRKFTKYYILELFYGARKQVFLTFAPYVLIVKYGAKTELIAVLYGIWSVANIFLSPLVGRLMDRIGYKKLLVADAAILVALCFLYGFSHHLFSEGTAFIVVSVVFVIDAMLFVTGMARAMYAKTISDNKAEVTSTLSTGISINHLISILIAIAGGILWQNLGIEVLFLMAAAFGTGLFFFSLSLPVRRKM